MKRGRSTGNPTKSQAARFEAMREIGFIAVPGLPHTYVNDDGEVYSDHPGNRWRGALHKLTPSDNGRGYLRVRCYGKARCVHLLVAITFLGAKPPGMEVNHRDGNKQNNRPVNLEYVTRSENMKHAHEHGLAHNPEGERHHMVKLTAEEARELRAEYSALRAGGRLPDGAMKALQQKYGLSDKAITDIGRGKTWRGLT